MLIGKKLLLRPIESRDLEVLRQIKNDPEIAALSAETPVVISEEAQQEWFVSQKTDSKTLRFTCATIPDDQCVGLVGLWDLDPVQKFARVGIKLAKTLPKGMGYGTDAVNIISAYAFTQLRLHRLETSILDINKGSFKLFIEKCGWKVEGIQRERYFLEGKYRDITLAGILESEFRGNSNSQQYLKLLDGKL